MNVQVERGIAQRPPPGVLIYGPLHVVWALISWAVGRFSPTIITGFLVAGLIWYGLWRRSTVTLVIARVLNVFPLLLGIGHLFGEYPVLGVTQIVGSLIVFALLFAPATKAWFGERSFPAD